MNSNEQHARWMQQFNGDVLRRSPDIELIVEGQVVRSHRSLVICFSPYLKRKLIGVNGKPINNKVYIPKVRKNELDVLLHYMYTGDFNVTCDNFLEIYEATSILEMQDVRQECLRTLECLDDVRTYFYLFVTSKKLGVPSNSMRVLRVITHRFEEVICTPEFLQLSVDLIIEILSSESIGARSEVIVFLAALKWLNHNYVARSRYEVRVMECVRFSSMSMDEVVACYHPPYLSQVLKNTEVVMMLFRATCYITAKFLGQETWFKTFGTPKRNLAFENLRMELWHQKSTTVSDMEIKQNWSKSPSFNFSPKLKKTTTVTELQIIEPQETSSEKSDRQGGSKTSIEKGNYNKSNFISHQKSTTVSDMDIKQNWSKSPSFNFSPKLKKTTTVTELQIIEPQETSSEKSDRQGGSKTSIEKGNYNKSNFISLSELNIHKNDQSNETSTLKARSFDPDSVQSLVKVNRCGSDFVVEIDTPTSTKNLDEIPVQEPPTEMLSDKILQNAEESTAPIKKKKHSNPLRAGGHTEKTYPKQEFFSKSEHSSDERQTEPSQNLYGIIETSSKEKGHSQMHQKVLGSDKRGSLQNTHNRKTHSKQEKNSKSSQVKGSDQNQHRKESHNSRSVWSWFWKAPRP